MIFVEAPIVNPHSGHFAVITLVGRRLVHGWLEAQQPCSDGRVSADGRRDSHTDGPHPAVGPGQRALARAGRRGPHGCPQYLNHQDFALLGLEVVLTFAMLLRLSYLLKLVRAAGRRAPRAPPRVRSTARAQPRALRF